MAEITVTDFTGLKNALEDPAYDVIKLGADIVFASGGALVPRSKTSVLIDGQGFTVTDHNSLSVGNTLRYVNAAGDPATVTIQNVKWSGRNFFGLFYTNPNANFENFTLKLNNVDYTGPQPVYNRTGTTYYIDSNFNLEQNGSSSVPEELGEVNRVVIQGNVTVESQTTGVSVLWFLNSDSSLVVDAGASFNVNASSTYMFYTDGTPPPSMLFSSGSSTNIRTRWGLFYTTGANIHTCSSFTLQPAASFTSTQNDRRATPSFKCTGDFSVLAGSTLYISAESAGTSPLMYFSNRSTLTFDDPSSVVLLNNGGNVFDFSGGTAANPNTIDINTELLNMWLTAGDGGFDDIPKWAGQKKDGSNITATLKTSTSAITALTNNIVDGDKGYPMTAATFNALSAKVISMGRLPIKLDPVRDISTAITGSTNGLSNLRADYVNDGVSVRLQGAADGGGVINLAIPDPIEVNTIITFGSNWKYLTKYITVTVQGSVTITYVEDLIFPSMIVPCRRAPVKRKKPDWYIEVTDTRTGGNDWLLYVWVNLPLTSGVNTLDNALILEEAASTVLSPAHTLVRREPFTVQDAVTKITWADIKGFLLMLNPDFVYNAGKYTTLMNWEVIEDE